MTCVVPAAVRRAGTTVAEYHALGSCEGVSQVTIYRPEARWFKGSCSGQARDGVEVAHLTGVLPERGIADAELGALFSTLRRVSDLGSDSTDRNPSGVLRWQRSPDAQ
jgi:hypothetical protein